MAMGFFKKLLSHKRESPIIGADKPTLKASAEYGGMGERELQLRLELILDKMASGDPAIYATARGLTAYSLSEQERFLRAAQDWRRQSPEFACQFCHHGLTAFKRLKGEAWDDWLLWLGRALRRDGLAASKKIRQLDSYLSEHQPSPQAATLKELMPVLSGLLVALGGRRLKIQDGDIIHTDTSTIYLPARCERFSSYEENRGFYKLALVFAWAQTWFASWQVNLQVLLYDLDERQLRLFQALEGVRLEACIERILPGIGRLLQTMGRQRDRLPAQQAWQKAAQRLQQPDATVRDSIAWINKLPAVKSLTLAAYQGRFQPLAVRQALNTRAEKEKRELQETLRGIARQQGKGSPGQTLDKEKRFSIKTDRAKPRGARQIEFTMDGEPVELTPQLERLLRSISQDWDEIPPQWLRVAMDKSPADNARRIGEQAATKTPAENESQIYVPEWDHSINDYRPNWCRVFLREAEAGDAESGRRFTQAVKSRRYGLISRLRNSFEFLRAANLRMRRQTDGDDIDIDALIDSLIAARRGEEPDAEIYTQNRKVGRNVAVVFMVDMSGSTRGAGQPARQRILDSAVRGPVFFEGSLRPLWVFQPFAFSVHDLPHQIL